MYYAKLSLIELCGWIEVSMDGIVRACAKKHVKDANKLLYIENTVIGPTYGFTYNDHFRGMLIEVIGQPKVEELENALDPLRFHLMKSSLGSLRVARNQEAHTYLANITQTLLAPSTINKHFLQVYDGLKDLEICVRRLKV